MLSIYSELKNFLHGSVQSVICACTCLGGTLLHNYFSCYLIGIDARLNAGKEEWEELWGREKRLGNSEDQRNWIYAPLMSKNNGIPHTSFPISCPLVKCSNKFGFPFSNFCGNLSFYCKHGKLCSELVLVIKGFFGHDIWNTKYSVCDYRHSLKLKNVTALFILRCSEMIKKLPVCLVFCLLVWCFFFSLFFFFLCVQVPNKIGKESELTFHWRFYLFRLDWHSC